MREPDLVADGVRAMQDAVDIPVTVKHRIGVDDQNDYGFVRDFVGRLFDVGCRVFIVHARSAILKGLSPKENREIPPLNMSVVRQLKQDFPEAIIVANGGIHGLAQVVELMAADGALPAVDGVMLGRAAYHDPWVLHEIDQWISNAFADASPKQRADILPPLEDYFQKQVRLGVPPKHMTRHWHGLFHGQPGARVWRREICEGQVGPLKLYQQLMSRV